MANANAVANVERNWQNVFDTQTDDFKVKIEEVIAFQGGAADPDAIWAVTAMYFNNRSEFDEEVEMMENLARIQGEIGLHKGDMVTVWAPGTQYHLHQGEVRRKFGDEYSVKLNEIQTLLGDENCKRSTVKFPISVLRAW